MKNTFKAATGVSFLAILAVVGSLAVIHAPFASAATGPPNITMFENGQVECMADSESGSVRFSGTLQTDEYTVLKVGTDYGWPALTAGSLMVTVNGEAYPDQSYVGIPPWDGVPGNEPQLEVHVNGQPLSQPVYIELRWLKGEFNRIAAASASDEGCTLESN